jgi:hypothetical protein
VLRVSDGGIRWELRRELRWLPGRAGCLLTMPSLSDLMPWSRILRRVLSRAPSTSPSGGPSRISLSRDMASAARDRLLKAERLVAVAAVMAAVLNCAALGMGGASLLARPRCGERLLLA